MNPANDHAHIENDIIYSVMAGDQTIEAIQALREEVVAFADQLRKNNQPVRVFADINQIGKETAETRKASVELIKNVMPDRAVIFGRSVVSRYSTNFILRLSGTSDITRFFNNRQKALDFLLR